MALRKATPLHLGALLNHYNSMRVMLTFAFDAVAECKVQSAVDWAAVWVDGAFSRFIVE